MQTPFPSSIDQVRVPLWKRVLCRSNKARTMGDYVMMAVFGLMLGGLGVMLIVVGTREFFAQRSAMARAVEVEATVLSTRVITSRSMDTDNRLLRDNSTTSHTPEVRFAYSVRGVRYESDQLYPTVIQHGYASAEAAAEEIAPYKAGERTRAFVDESQPERAFLRRESSSGPVWFVVGGCLSFVLLGVIYRFM